jgi:hypothetical protein
VPHAEEYRSLTGVTDAIRDILRAAGRPIEATEIRDELTGRGFTGPQYRNLLTVIHNTLRRLDGKESRRVEDGAKVWFTWILTQLSNDTGIVNQ